MAVQRYVRFLPKSGSKTPLIGQPVDEKVDVGAAVRKGEEVQVKLLSGSSLLKPGDLTDKVETIGTLLSPVTAEEVGTIRCIGLNYKQHADEVGMSYPTEPTVFLKPPTSLADPWPAPSIIPKFAIGDECADYEAELAVIISKTCKNVSESEAMDYVLGYTACNDVSSRKTQFSQTQWCYSKGFDGACPIGPVLVTGIDPKKLFMKGYKNGEVMQSCGLDDLFFGVEKLISFLSQGTTLPAGTLIITGTPAGVGAGKKPPQYLKAGDEYTVEILPHIGTLTTIYQNEE